MLQRSFILLILILSLGCSNGDNSISETYFIASEYTGTAPTKGDMLFKLRFSDSLLQQDTIKMFFFGYAHHDIEDSYLSLNFPTGYKLKKVERHTKFTPTLMNYSDDDASTMLKLNDLGFTAKREIHDFNPINYKRRIYEGSPDANKNDLREIKKDYKVFLKSENVLHYPKVYINSFITEKFKDITPTQLSNSLNSELNKEEGMTTEEKAFWRSQVRKYKIGAFAKSNDVYKILYYKIYLDLELVKDDQSLNKVLEYDINM